MIKKQPTNDYRGELERKGVIAFVPEGTSMWPTIKGGKSSVVIEKKKSRLSKFDVAFYNRQDKNVLHRVIEVLQDGYLMCGDSLTTLEEVKEQDVFGVMIGFCRGKKYVSANDLRYIEEVEKLYSNESKRAKKIARFRFREKVKSKIKRIFKK